MKDFWNERYLEGNVYGDEANTFLKERTSVFPKDAKILCLAEGEGRNAIFLAKQGFQVTAVDFSETGMKHAKERAQKEGIPLTTVVADLNEYDIGENQWDGVVSIFGHLPPEIRKKVYAGITKGLKKGGVFLFEAYTPEQLEYGTGGPKDVSFLITEEIVQEGLSSLETIFQKKLLREIHEGKYHNGKSSVIQYIGKK